MNEAYLAKVSRSKAPKKFSIVKHILSYLLRGARSGYDNALLCEKLNAHGIKPLVADRWTPNSVAMQFLFIARLDEANSLARGFTYLLRTGDATLDDLVLIQSRTKQGQ